MSWLIDGKTFARKVKNPAYGICREPSRRFQLECPSCGHDFQQNEVWPGFPPGVKFDPSDQEVLEHLAAQVGVGAQKPHPFINEFIPTIDVDGGICYTHPEKLPGVRRDGSSTHFFCIPPKAYQTGTRKRRKIQTNEENGISEVRWHKTGKTRPIIENGKQLGCKKIMVLYTNNGKKEKPHKTNWVMHQYHLGKDDEEEEGQLVVSKVFYQTQPRQSNKANDDDDLEQPDLDISEGLRNDEQLDLATQDAWRKIEQTDYEFHFKQQDGMSNDPLGVVMLPPCLMKEPGASHESEVSNGVSSPKVTASELIGNAETVEDEDESTKLQIHKNEIDYEATTGGIQLSQEVNSSVSDSQLLGGSSFDAELVKFLSNEGIKSSGDVMGGLKNLIAEASSKMDSQEGYSLDKIFLGTPPEFLESLLANSQGEDWLEKLKVFSDSQKTDDFSLSQFLQSQSQQ